MKKIRSVGIVGMGALGLLYGEQITRGGQAEVSYLMDRARYERYRDTVYTINGEERSFHMVNLQDSQPVDLLMVCVKATGLSAAINIMPHVVGPDTIILSVMNGISSEQQIGRVVGMDHVIYCVAQGMDAMKFGNSLQYTRAGELRIGLSADTSDENVFAVQKFLEENGMAYTFEEDILHRLWCKFMLNVGINQTCMVFGVPYARALEEGTQENLIFISAMREVIAIAGAEGIHLTEDDLNFNVKLIGTLSPAGTPSMGQDRINRKPSEVELFAGTVIRIAEKHGIPVPVNRYLYRRVEEIEREYRNI